MKTSTKHTPGPWITEAFDTANGTAEQVFAMMDGTPVEVCDVSPDHEDGGIANARLIAAAPELLWVAQWLKDTVWADCRIPADLRAEWQSFYKTVAVAALNKATK